VVTFENPFRQELYELLAEFGHHCHNPEAVILLDGRTWAECECGWSTLPIPPPFRFAVFDAQAWHQRDVTKQADAAAARRRERV
jgi:hypothetical protein